MRTAACLAEGIPGHAYDYRLHARCAPLYPLPTAGHIPDCCTSLTVWAGSTCACVIFDVPSRAPEVAAPSAQWNGGCSFNPFVRTSTRQNRFFSMIVIVIVIVISKLLKRYSKAKRTRAPAYSRALRRIKGGFQRGVKRSSGPISRIPGGDGVAVKVGVVQVEKVNDQMGQGRRV